MTIRPLHYDMHIQLVLCIQNFRINWYKIAADSRSYVTQNDKIRTDHMIIFPV